jgi:hypothetical protein cresD4_01415
MWRFAAVVALALVYIAAVPVASAEPSPALIDSSARGSITVVKSAGDPFAHFGDPTRNGVPQPVPPIEGLEFQAQKVDGIDLTTNEGWEAASNLDLTDFIADGPRNGDLDKPQTATTDAEGKAHFSNLDLGLYLVTEKSGPAQSLGFNVINPFFVTVPSTATDSKSWDYDVTVHAKDQRIAARKAAAKRCIETGESVQMGMTSTLPAPDEKDHIGSFQIADPLAPELEYVTDSEEVFLTRADIQSEPNQLDAADFDVRVEANVATLNLRESGLNKMAKLRKGNPSATLTWRFHVKAVGSSESGFVKNKAFVIPTGYPDFDKETTPGIPTNEVRINIGNCGGETSVPPSDVPSVPHTTVPNEPGKPGGPGSTPEEPTVPVPVPGPGIPGHPEIFEPVPPAPPVEKPSSLAVTGANVVYLAIIGFGLLVAGAWLYRRGLREGDK